MYASVERRMASTPPYGSYVSALKHQDALKKPSSSKDTNRWMQSPHSSVPPSPSSSSSSAQPHQKQPHLFHTNSSNTQCTGIHETATTTTTIQSCDNNGTSEYTSNQQQQQQQQHQQHHHHQQKQQPNSTNPLPSTGFGINAAATVATGTIVSVSDGGWSHGMPEKGSGWSRNPMGASKESTGWEGGDVESNSDGTPSGWVEDNSLEKSGSGWLEGGANRPSSIGADGWGSKPVHKGPSEKEVWDQGNEIKQSSEGTLGKFEENRGRKGGMNGVSMWGANKNPRDVEGTNWKVTEDSAGNAERHSDYSTDTYSPPSEDNLRTAPNGQRKVDGDAGRSYERETHGYSHSQESYRCVNSSPAAFGPPDSASLGSSGGTTTHSDYQTSGNFSSSHDSHMTGSDDTENHSFEPPYSRVSPRNGAGTPIQAGGRSGGATPTFWVSGRVGSTSSMSSMGSTSSWKGDNKNGGFSNRSNSPRKSSNRFDGSTGSHTPVSTPSLPTINSYGNVMLSGKGYSRKSKKMLEYEEGLVSLQSAPSGWGELPSPKLSDLDNGTEFWGVPPDDLERQKSKSSHAPSSTIPSGDMGWLDGSPPEVDWVEDWRAGGGGGPTPDQVPSNWRSFNKDKMVFTDNVIQLMNMGMNRQSAEKLLGSANNNLEMAMLVAAGEDTAFEMGSGGGGGGGSSFSPRKAHGNGKGSQNVVTPTFSSASSGMGLGQDLIMPLNTMQGMQTPSAQQANSQSQLKLLQMQQQYLLPGGAPNQPLNLQNYLQALNQRYVKLQKNKQVLTQQLKMCGGDASATHQINLKLQRTQHVMSQIDQQRLVMIQLPNQQQDGGGVLKSQDSVGLGSPMMGVAGNPPRGKGFSGKQGSMGRSHSTSGILEEGSMEAKGLTYNMQGLSLGASVSQSSVSQSSARSVSRFHQIFSGSSSDNLMGLAGDGDMILSGGSQGSSPFSPPQGGVVGSAFPTRNESTSTASTPSGSFPFVPSGKPYSDIQEFRPGIPWQPRSQATEPAQLYSKQASMPVSGLQYGDNYTTMAPSPVFTNLPSPMMGPSQPAKPFAGGSSMGAAPHKYMRSNSTGSGFYGGSGYMSGKRLPSPFPTKYNRSDGIRQPLGGGGVTGGWSGSSGSSLSSEGTYGGSVQTRTVYPGRAGNNTAQSPVSMAASQFPPGSAGTTWKSHKQQQQQHSRRIAPPTSLPPRVRGNELNSSSRNMGGTPLGTQELFGSTPSSEKNWGALAMTPGSAVLSNPVWGSTPLNTPDDPSVALNSQQSQWGRDNVSKIWNQALGPDTFPSAPSKPPGLSVNSGPSSQYMKVPNEQGGGPSDGSFASTPSFSSGSSTWGQDETKSSVALKDAFSPEPTFAEWQAGKKARLSVFNMPPSMATSPWLVIRNINTQIDAATLRDVCCEYGTVRVCHTHYQSELALICFSSMEEAIQAKAGLDKSPAISGVPVHAQFASEANIKELCEQLQVGINSENQHRGWPRDTPAESSEITTTVSHKTSLSLSDVNTRPQWDTPSSTPFARQTSEVSTPGSMWSDGGFLSGFSSPWLSSGPVSSSSMGGNTTSSGPCSMTSPQDAATVSNFTLPSNCSGQSFLPGGLV